ncbi:hypothetical protein AKO1_008762, partial [Acrasis kona]
MSIKPKTSRTFKGRDDGDEKGKPKRTNSGFDSMFVDHKVFTYEVEGIPGKFEYNGTVDQNGIKNGRGELKYPNGTMYEGDFFVNKRHGFGKLIFSTDKKGTQSLAIGQWKNDMPSDEIPWKITHSTWEYWGHITLDRNKKNIELLKIDDFHKNKQGELYDVKSNFKYFGSFKDNKKEGFGVATFSNGDRYYGGWKDDYLNDFGTYLFKDGTIFQGTYKAGIRTGRGTLYQPNGDTIEGTWNDHKIEGATWRKGNTRECTITMLNQVQNEIMEALRSNGNIGFMVEKTGTMDGSQVGAPTKHKWQTYQQLNEKNWIRESEMMRQRLITSNGCKSEQRDVQYVLNTLPDVKRVIQVLFDGTLDRENEGFIKGFVSFFLSCFHGSYYTGGAGSSQLRKKISNLMSHAIDDVKSFIEYLTDLIVQDFLTVTFDRITDTFVNNSNLRSVVDTINNTQSESQHVPIKVYSWDVKNELQNQERVEILKNLKLDVKTLGQGIIAHHIHSKSYQTFFPLYEVNFQEKDLLMNQKINSVPNCSLQSMGVDKKFIPFDESNVPYQKAIQILEKIVKEKSVTAKVKVLSDVRDSVMTEIRLNRLVNRQEQFKKNGKVYTEQDREEDENFQPGADDSTSVYSYVFMRARVRNHHAQFQYINDWRDQEVTSQPVSHLIAFYEGFLTFVMGLDHNLKTEDGQFISTYSISKSLERGIEKQVFTNKNQPFSFYWLPSLLIHIGLEIGGLKITTKSTQRDDQSSPVSPMDAQPARSTLVIPKDKEILDMNNQNLMNALIDNISMVNKVLDEAKKDIGFQVKLEDADS